MNDFKPPISNGVIGMIIFLAAESMLFFALISANNIYRAGVPVWPPYDAPLLPFWISGFNLVILLYSGFQLRLAALTFEQGLLEQANRYYKIAVALGLFFLFLQGYEWVSLVHGGLTMSSSNYGAFFFLIIGVHAAHALAALGFLASLWFRLTGHEVAEQFSMARYFWYFVIGFWPLIFYTLYLP